MPNVQHEPSPMLVVEHKRHQHVSDVHELIAAVPDLKLPAKQLPVRESISADDHRLHY